MTDTLTPAQRSERMSRIRGKDTKPEMLVRRALHAMGFRFRLHDGRLPGRPDIHLPKWNAVIFVHGCMWHGHGCDLYRVPKSNVEFWRSKIAANTARDRRHVEELRAAGLRVATIWECSLKGKRRLGIATVAEAVAAWLRGTEPSLTVPAHVGDSQEV